MGAHMAEFGFAFTLGNAIAQPVQSAIVQGFQIGIGLMTKPFQYFGNAFAERVQDELSDLKAAGGFLSISKRSQNPFVKNIDEAIQFQQQTNETFAKMAAALPGVTNDYVQVGKRLGDTAARIVNQDFKGALEEANRIRQTSEGRKFYGGQIAATGPEAQREVIETLLGELTKKTTIAGLGGRTGAGGIAGAYGLPGLTERMLSQQEVSMGQFQRYAAVFSDPTISDALQRNIAKINATQMNSVDRFKAIQKLLDEVVTPELIEKLRTSVDGVYQGLKSVIFDPDTGLFGIGRNFKEFGKKINQYGQYVNKAGEVVKDIADAADEDLSIFEIVRDVFSNFGQALLPVVESLQLVFDPLKKVANVLMDARHYAAEFNRVFNQYRQGLLELSKTKTDAFKNTVDVRASLSTINAFLKNFGVITDADFKNFGAQLMSENLDVGKMITTLIDKILNSKIAEDIGKLIGEVIGTVLTEVAKVTGFISGRVAGTSKLFDGVRAGFEEAGGVEALKNIFSDVFKTLFKILVEVLKLIPFEGKMLIAAMVILPAIVQGVGMLIAEKMLAGIMLLRGKAGDMVTKSFATAATQFDARGGRRRITGGGIGAGQYRGRPQRHGAGGSIERLNRMRRARYARAAASARANAAYGAEPFVNYARTSRLGQGAMGAARGAGRLARSAGRLVPGGALAAGAIDMGIAMASGENFGKAAVGAIGTVLGGTAGTVFGPVGTAIGATLGGMLADASSDFILGALDQNHAAKLQMEAAQKQVDAAASSAQQKYGPDFGAQLGGVEALNNALGGGAGVKAYAEEQLRLGKILPEQAQSWNTLGTQLTDVNKTTAAVEKAQKAYDNAVKLNTGKQKEYKDMLEKAKGEQERALSRISANWESMSTANRTKLLSAADGIVDALNGAAAKIRGWKGIPALTPAPPPKSPVAPKPTTESPMDRKQSQQPLDSRKLIPGLPATPESGFGVAKGHLGDAIRYEMKNKPSGSDLLIANSSETVIPAAGGYGMVDFVDTLKWGFATMIGAFKQAQQKQDSLLSGINQTLKNNQQQTNTRLFAMEKKFSTPGMTGGLGGGAAGGVDAFTPIAQRMGLTMTSGYRPGDPGWHGANRARDFSNGTGPTPQMMQFAQYMASTYGSNLKELIYTPLGFSIKNGQRVAPYAQGAHYNHVHVAYGLGQGNPAFFGSQSAAERWERSMVSGSVKIGSVTGNSAEGFGSGSVGDIYVTVNAGSTNDPDQLAYMVAERIQAAVGDAVNANILV
jgi:hypothetical protein